MIIIRSLPHAIIPYLAIAILICCSGITIDSSNLNYRPDNQYEVLLEEFDIKSRMDHYGVPGISIGVIKNAKLDWARGYGVLQKGTDHKVNTETVFSVGSVSKVGTAILILKLQEDGHRVEFSPKIKVYHQASTNLYYFVTHIYEHRNILRFSVYHHLTFHKKKEKIPDVMIH